MLQIKIAKNWISYKKTQWAPMSVSFESGARGFQRLPSALKWIYFPASVYYNISNVSIFRAP